MDNISVILDEAGLKKTKIRMELIDVVLNANQLYSAQDLYTLLVEKDTEVNLSSVYRSLEKLVEAKVFKQVNLDNHKQALYEFSTNEHHHFLVCEECNKVIKVHHCPVAGYGDELEDKYDFEVTSHKVEYYGVCSRCKE